jgi:hypothetical protein
MVNGPWQEAPIALRDDLHALFRSSVYTKDGVASSLIAPAI